MTAKYNPLILETAGKYLGLQEYPGAKHNDQIIALFAAVGHSWVKDDETPWCAAFVGSVLAELGLPNTGKLNARSYVDYGDPVSKADLEPGDIVVFWRGSPDGWQGHVAFFVRFDGDKIVVRGGNQSNRVTDAPYPLSRVLAYRRADPVPAANKSGRPTIRKGDRGAFVMDAQVVLKGLGYKLGDADGHFGPLTTAAVMAFQDEGAMRADGVIGPKTWDALMSASPRPLRDKTEADLRKGGSRTIKVADEGEKAAKTGAAATVGLGALTAALDVGEKVSEAQTTIEGLQATLASSWPVLGIIAIGVVAYFWGPRIMQHIRDIRVDDAQTGANLGK